MPLSKLYVLFLYALYAEPVTGIILQMPGNAKSARRNIRTDFYEDMKTSFYILAEDSLIVCEFLAALLLKLVQQVRYSELLFLLTADI